MRCPACNTEMPNRWLPDAREKRHECPECGLVEYTNAKDEVHA